MPRNITPPDPPQPSIDGTLDEPFSPTAREVIDRGNEALLTERRSVERWVAAGAAWKTLQLAAMHRSNSNRPAGRRYSDSYAILSHSWPELNRVDITTRSDAIWLFENAEIVRLWYDRLDQKQRDRWTHPTTIKNHYRQRSGIRGGAPPSGRQRPPRQTRPPRERQSLTDRTPEDLEAIIADQEDRLADYEREVSDLGRLVDQKDGEIAWLRAEVSQQAQTIRNLEQIAGGSPSHPSAEIEPPISLGQTDWPAWARALANAISGASDAHHLDALRIDNANHFAAYETAYPGAGRGLEARIDARLAELHEERLASDSSEASNTQQQ
jgi:hypothetical protein